MVGTNVYWLKKNMVTSLAMIKRHYRQTNALVGIEHETGKRKKLKRAGIAAYKVAAPAKARWCSFFHGFGSFEKTS